MARDKGVREGSAEVADMIQDTGVNLTDPQLKRGELICSAGTASEPTEEGGGIRFKLLISHTISYSKEYEVEISDQDEITYKPVAGHSSE